MNEEKEVQPTGKLPPIRPKSSTTKPASYTVLAGFNFGCTPENDEGTRVEPGPLTISLPPKVLADLLELGAVVEVKE